MSTFAVYEKANRTVTYPWFYAMFTTGDKASAGGRSRTNFTGNADEANEGSGSNPEQVITGLV